MYFTFEQTEDPDLLRGKVHKQYRDDCGRIGLDSTSFTVQTAA